MIIGDFQVDTNRATLETPHCIVTLRPWVNVGNVGHMVLNRLSRIYGGIKVGQLTRPSKFYDFTRYRPQIYLAGGERRFRIPNTQIHAARVHQGPDLLFLRLLEPHSWAEDFNESVLEVLKTLNVQRYVLVGSMYDSVPHSRPLKVTGSVRGWVPSKEFSDRVRLGRSSYQGPTSMVSQLTERVRTELGLETLSMIVHLPMYLKVEDDYAGASRLLSILAELYNAPLDQMPEINMGEAQYSQVRQAMSNNSRLKELVAKLESEYDSEEDAEDQQRSTIELNPEIEQFLSDIAQEWNNNPEDTPNPGPRNI